MTIETIERKLKRLQTPVENDFLRWLYLHLPPQPMKSKRMHRAYKQAVQILMRESNELGAADSKAVDQYLRGVIPFVAQFEKSEFPLGPATAEEVLGFLMDQNDLSQYDLAKELGGQPVVSEVINGRRKLTREHIERLSRRFAVSPATFYPGGAESPRGKSRTYSEMSAPPAMVHDKIEKRKARRTCPDTLPDETSFPDWRERLARVRREQAAGKTYSLEEVIARRKRRMTRKPKRSRP